MMRLLEVGDLDAITLGATFLGNGGGGDPYQAKLMAHQAIEDFGAVQLVSLEELPDDALIVSIAVLGAPTVLIEKIPSGQLYVDAVKSLASYLGKEIAAIIPVEVGGMNTLVPLMVAAELGLPCVDADGMRRAFPQIEMTVFTLAGISASPVALADEHGNTVIVVANSNQTAEKLIRNASMNLGLANSFASYPMTIAEAKGAAIRGSLTYCENIGRMLQQIQHGTKSWEDMYEMTGGRTLFEGKIVDLDRRTTSGFARGTVVIEKFADQSTTMRIEIQNEMLLAIENGRTVLTPPDLICMVDHETAEPITTEQLAYGQRVRVIGLPCAPEWHREGMLEVAGPAAFGYDVDYVDFHGGTA